MSLCGVNCPRFCLGCFLALLLIRLSFFFSRNMNTKLLKIGILTALLSAVAIGVGLFFGLRAQPQEHIYAKAAVATDAGPCSVIGR